MVYFGHDNQIYVFLNDYLKLISRFSKSKYQFFNCLMNTLIRELERVIKNGFKITALVKPEPDEISLILSQR
jgi:hypothetical protein